MSLRDTISRNFRMLIDHGEVSLYAIVIATSEPPAIVRSWYAQRTTPDLHHLEKICDAYRLDPRFFFYDHRKPAPTNAPKALSALCGQNIFHIATRRSDPTHFRH